MAFRRSAVRFRLAPPAKQADDNGLIQLVISSHRHRAASYAITCAGPPTAFDAAMSDAQGEPPEQAGTLYTRGRDVQLLALKLSQRIRP
jgi:hypothetical protein